MVEPALLHVASPTLMHDDRASAAMVALRMLYAQQPAVPELLTQRHAVVVAFELPFNRADRPMTDVLAAALERAIPRFEHTAAPGSTALYVGSTFASDAKHLHNVNFKPRAGHYLGTIGGAEGGMLFFSNINDLVIASRARIGAAVPFLRGALDTLLGPAV